MEPIHRENDQLLLNDFANKKVYIFIETTHGDNASTFGNKEVNVGPYIRNAHVICSKAVIQGDIGYRDGLNTELGWVYAEGLTDFELMDDETLLMAGHDEEGRLMVAMQISEQPFE